MGSGLHHVRLPFTTTSSIAPCLVDSTSLFVKSQVSSRLGQHQQQARHAHFRRNASSAVTGGRPYEALPSLAPAAPMTKPLPPLSILPFRNLLRSYFITAVSSSPLSLRLSLRALKFFAHSTSAILHPDRNPILHFLLKRTVYSQFCAGETAVEVSQTIDRLKQLGYQGVMLGYAREVCMGSQALKALGEKASQAELNATEIATWAEGTLSTLRMAQPGDFVSVKFTGAGSQALQHLSQRKPAAPQLEKAIVRVCELAKTRDVKLQFDAEQDAVQPGIDLWTLEYMKRYNRDGKALVHGTYQAYLKSTPRTLAHHLDLAFQEGFVLGVKLVRGAYLGCDPRRLFWDTIEQTHTTYDGIAESLMRRRYNDVLRPTSAAARTFPSVSLVLAGHNEASIGKAQEIRNSQASSAEPRISLAYGQLMGMAENISCGLVNAGKLARQDNRGTFEDIPKVYQYLVWGSVGECCQYLVRRAEENQDAMARTKDGRKALGKELLRRLGI